MTITEPKQYEWISRSELNWCCYCWFNAKIESRPTDIGTMWLCHNCGICIHAYEDGTGKGSLGEDLPCFFNKEGEEWNEWLKAYQKRI